MQNLRNSFLHYFKSKAHKIYPSAPLVPHHDDSLMFVNAGMAPFKDYFLQKSIIEDKSIVTAQKCVRAGGKHNDLENVGFTTRHHTFFEMLGNFSFGEYFKEHAIYLAWNFLTSELGLDKNKLYITIYHNDDEAYNIWKKLSGFADDKIIRIATDDNFWQMGSTGPCGPCSEIFYDHGDHLPGLLPDKGDTGERFVEIWNLVFMQFNKDLNGVLTPLPEKCIDTGMGLERIAAVVEGTPDNYEIEIFKMIMQQSRIITKNNLPLHAHRIIIDHLRSSAFLIAEGVMPSNQGRGYVLRKIIRRAVRYIHMLGYNKPLFSQLLPFLQEYMGAHYPELIRAESSILSVMDNEENIFRNTLSRGIEILSEITKNITILDGNKAFMLYDTYGFPLEITQEIMREKNISVDITGFEVCMQEQKERAKKTWIGSGEKTIDEELLLIKKNYGETQFVGYDSLATECKIIKVIEQKQSDKLLIVLDTTPFYAESGGQEGDKGRIYAADVDLEVLHTTKVGKTNVHLHECIVHRGTPVSGMNVAAKVNDARRNATKVAHSATHILHHILIKELGAHVAQKGSLVSEDRLRFDFSHPRATSKSELIKIENEVNDFIWQNHKINIDISNLEDAFKGGAIGLFGEKYEEDVRVISIGPSKELCGGTHVNYSAEIGIFKIVDEHSVASGVRRIEALTRYKALEFTNNAIDAAQDKISELKNQLVMEQKKSANTLYALNKKTADLQHVKPCNISGVNYITKVLSNISLECSRRIITEYRDSAASSVIVIMNNYENKSTLIVAVTKDITNKINAAELIKVASSAMEIKGGGGKADMAQCSSDINKKELAFEAIKNKLQ